MKKLAVEVLCGARGGRCRALVARLWWTPDPEPLRLNTSSITVYTLPREVAGLAILLCVKHDGNKGQQHVDLHEFLSPAVGEYSRTGRVQTVTLQEWRTR
jgi:hypothetical protein